MDLSENLSKREMSIIRDVGTAEVERLRKLYVPNLTRHKEQIIGFRAEDLFMFLQFLKYGRISVSGNGIMDKIYKNALYITPNPKSLAMRQCRYGTEETFSEAATSTISLYQRMAIMGPINREVRPLIENEKRMLNSWTSTLTADPGDRGINEDFYDALIDEIRIGDGRFNYKNRLPAHYLLGHYLKTEDQRKVLELFKKIKDRRGIILGFNDLLIKKYGDPKKGDSAEDMRFDIPEGSTTLDCLLGFEVLGDLEEGVVKMILKN